MTTERAVRAAQSKTPDNSKAFHLISLGWVTDGETDFEILDLSQESISHELLRRRCAELAVFPREIEHASDQASTLAQMHGQDPDAAASRVRKEMLAKGIGISFWLLDAATYWQWKAAWDERCALIDRWVESGSAEARADALCDDLFERFWSVFKQPPLIQLALGALAEDAALDDLREATEVIWQSVIRMTDGVETNPRPFRQRMREV